MEKSDSMGRYGTMAAVVLFGSIWGMFECILGSVKLSGAFADFPMGALLGGFFGLGLMAMTRRVYGVMWMQLGMGLVAGFLRFWAPIGTCVVCSALAIVAESLVFELIFNRSIFELSDEKAATRSAATLVMLGVITGYVIYVTGYLFTQTFTPIVAKPHVFVMSDLAAALPLIFGRGFFAAIFGAISLPIAVLYSHIVFQPMKIKRETYYAASFAIAAVCWLVVIARFYL